MFRLNCLRCTLAACVVTLLPVSESWAFYTNGYWSQTATNGATGPVGTPVTVTWSIVPDATFIPGEGGSDLISFLDGLFPGGFGSDLTQRPWFPFLQESFGRWNALSGINFVYEPADDGVALRGLSGSVGVRGDVRLGGAYLDGASGTLASTSFLLDADITIDTGDGTYYSNPLPNNTYQNIHNTLTHEIGHALGLAHVESNNAIFLMEPFTNAAINGPQLDDIRGVQFLYGDVEEKSHGGAGNNTLATATPFGLISPGQPVARGVDATTNPFVLLSEVDFLSISNQSDLDWFSFEIDGPATVDLTVTPLGFTYNERPGTVGSYTATNAVAISDLSVELYSWDGANSVLLAGASAHPIGQPETLLDVALSEAGTYYVRVSGSGSATQLYQLSVASTALVLSGDFDANGRVDGADFLAWQRNSEVGDLVAWQANYGQPYNLSGQMAVPEPGLPAFGMAWLALAVFRRLPGTGDGLCSLPGTSLEKRIL